MKKKSLIISEPPLQVLPSLASAIGLNEAIVVQQLHYWITNSKNEGFTDENGAKWIYNTYADWKENFPFWSESTIQRIFSGLEKSGIVISEQKDKSKYDRKKYYRLNYDAIDDPKLVGIDDVKLTRSLNESETTPKTTSYNTKDFPVDWQVAAGLSGEEIAKHNTKEQDERRVADNFERQMGFNPLPWWSDKDLGALLRFLMDKTPEDVAKFAEWAKRDFSSLKPAKARQYPRLVIECWPQAFDKPKKAGRTLRAT